ncbi:MAG: hypothetical protein ACXWVH_06315, partial [Caulobacteraceae bacterium]
LDRGPGADPFDPGGNFRKFGEIDARGFPQNGGSAANAPQARAAMGAVFFFLLPPSTLGFAVGPLPPFRGKL